MIQENLELQVEELFQETEKAHHDAFRETEGKDPEWPLWYAEHLQSKLGEVLNAKFTKSELTYMIVTAEKQREMEAPGSDWPRFWAGFFVDRYF